MVLNEHVTTDSVFVPIEETQQDVSKQFFIIKFKDVQPAGHQYNVRLKYTGRFQDNMEGFYKSSYSIKNTVRLIPHYYYYYLKRILYFSNRL